MDDATEGTNLVERIKQLEAIVAAYANPRNWRPLHGMTVGSNEKPLLVWAGKGEGPDKAKGGGGK
jgi:hypothetical protein